MNADSMFRLSAFGEIAFRICSEGLYQQDMPEILTQFENRSARHRLLVEDLSAAFSMVRTVLHDAANAQRGAT
jgi:hypothetical protein